MSIDERPPSTVAPSFASLTADRVRLTHTVAAAALVVGTLMPWVSVLWMKMSGTDADHGLPFYAALAGLAVVVFGAQIPQIWRLPKVWVYRVLAVGMPLIAAGEAAWVIYNVNTDKPEDNEFFDVSVSLQPGIFLTFVAAITCIAMVVVAARRDRANEQ